MWLRTVRSHGLTPEGIQQALERYRREDLPLIESAPGLLGLALGSNRHGGSVGSATIWSSRETMEDSEKLSARARERVIDLLQAPDHIIAERFEVLMTDRLDLVADVGRPPHMRIVRYQGVPAERIQAAAESYRRDYDALVGKTSGFLGIVLAANEESESVATVTFWRTLRDMRESERLSEAARRNATIAARPSKDPLADRFEVAVSCMFERLVEAQERAA